MAVTPAAIQWERGQDLLQLQISFGYAAVGTGNVTFGYASSGAAFGPSYPAYLQNQGIGLATVTPAGASPGPPVSLSTVKLRGDADFLRIAPQYMLDQIVALDATVDNFVRILQSGSASVGEVMKQSGNVLPMGFMNSQNATDNQTDTPYCQIAGVMGNAVHGFWFVLTTTPDSMAHGVTNFGKNTIEMTLRPVDLGYPWIQYGEY